MISSAVSALADAALLLPAAALLILYLAALRAWRLVFALALSLAAAGVAMVALKLVFNACGHAIADGDVVSPSGHAGFGTAFWGALAILLAAGRPRAFGIFAAAGTALLLAAVGISRVRLGVHSPAEVIFGHAVGGAALLLFAVLHGRAGRPRLPLLPVAIGLAAALALLGGDHFSLEEDIARYAREAADRLDVCAPREAAADGRFSSVRH